MARFRFQSSEKDTVLVEGSAAFVERVIGYLQPVLYATFVSLDIVDHEQMLALKRECDEAMAAVERGEDYEGEYVSAKHEE